jgi:hypothetical protein
MISVLDETKSIMFRHPLVNISISSASSLKNYFEEHYIQIYKSEKKELLYKNIEINGIKAIEVFRDREDKKCSREIILYKNRKVFSVYGQEGSCDYDNDDINSVISSLTFPTVKLQTYHSDLFGYDIQYPKEWTLHYDRGTIYLDDPSQKDSKNEPSTVLSISGHYVDKERFPSTYEWISSFFSDSDVMANGAQITEEKYRVLKSGDSEEFMADKCGENITIPHNGIVFLLQYRSRGFDICKSDTDTIESVVSSFKFTENKTYRDLVGITFSSSIKSGEYQLQENKTKLVNNSGLETIYSDFKEGMNVNAFYTTKDKNKTYFVFCADDLEACYGTIVNYLDIKEMKYHRLEIYYSSGLYESLENGVSFLPIDHGYSKEIYLFDLEKTREVLAYSIKNSNESLSSECNYTGHGGVRYENNFEITKNNILKVGVYKEVGQSTKPCTEETVGKYEKIRDDFVDLNKL